MHAASTPCARAPRDFVRAADFAASAAARLRIPPGYARLIRCVSVRATQCAVQSAERGRVRRALPPGPPAREVSYDGSCGSCPFRHLNRDRWRQQLAAKPPLMLPH
jgi:hypothetical protein